MNHERSPAMSDTAAFSAVPAYRAESLTEGGQLALIQLDDKVYTLRITRQGKLILTK